MNRFQVEIQEKYAKSAIWLDLELIGQNEANEGI